MSEGRDDEGDEGDEGDEEGQRARKGGKGGKGAAVTWAATPAAAGSPPGCVQTRFMWLVQRDLR